MLLIERALNSMEQAPDEPIVFDHFETFEFTQDLPFGVGTPVGAESWFVYGIDPAPHRRAGRRSEAQLRRLRARTPHGVPRARLVPPSHALATGRCFPWICCTG